LQEACKQHSERANSMSLISGALVVLFHPSETQVRNLLHLRRLCTHIVAVDNSPEINPYLRERMKAADIEILDNFNQGGIAGAFNRGIDRLIARGYNTFFLFDQDSEVSEDYFEQMLSAVATLDGPRFLIGPKVFDVNVGRYLPAHVVQRFGIKPVTVTEENFGLVSCSSVISSGSVLSLETYHLLGPFPEGYFIDQVDTEYSFRAVCKGVPIYVNTALTMKHELGKRTVHKFLFFKLTQWDMNPMRQYYSARNCIHISRSYGVRFPLLNLINILTVIQIASVLLYERNKREKLMAVFAGLLDGVRNRYGAFETCCPRIFAFCALRKENA
jgi:rhamnosyltransferase